MKVFLSSVVAGLEPYREAAVRAAQALGHEARRSEDFPAMADSPQQACLAGVRWSDVVVLLLGDRYGSPLLSGLSATHEEYREARESRPVLAFVQEGVDPDPAEGAFIEEVRKWEQGRVTAGFSTPDDLRDAVTRALHELELSNKAGAVDPAEMISRAEALIPKEQSPMQSILTLVVVGGPRQPILRPRDLENADLERFLMREALLGDEPVLSTSQGTSTRPTEHGITIGQRDASVYLDDLGSVRVTQPARAPDNGPGGGLPVLIEEDVRSRLGAALTLAGRILDRIDPVRRLSALVPVVALLGIGSLAWRTREEHARSPNSVQIPSGPDRQIVVLDPPNRARATLLHERDGLADDFVSVLRRRLKT